MYRYISDEPQSQSDMPSTYADMSTDIIACESNADYEEQVEDDHGGDNDKSPGMVSTSESPLEKRSGTSNLQDPLYHQVSESPPIPAPRHGKPPECLVVSSIIMCKVGQNGVKMQNCWCTWLRSVME